jgi:hypothetical protein
MNTQSTAGLTTPRARADGFAGDHVDPAQRLLAEAGRIRVKAVGRDLLLLRLGVVLMVAGPLVTVIGYAISSQTSSALRQNDAVIVALIGLTVGVVGVGLFLRYSLGEFLRFWMARVVYEQHQPSSPASPDVTHPNAARPERMP